MRNQTSPNRYLWRLLTETLGDGFAEDRDLQASIRKLSRLFTEERKLLPDYFNDKELRAAYLAYYVPLNFAKMRFIFDSYHKQIWDQDNPRELRWADLGCGPGTAALAALDSMHALWDKSKAPPPIHIDLIDSNPAALILARGLVTRMAEKLHLNVTVKADKAIPMTHPSKEGRAGYDLALAANVLNELPAAESDSELMMKLWQRTSGTMLVLETGHRVSSQRLIRFRERVRKQDNSIPPPAEGAEAPVANMRILGPCMHIDQCPLYRSKHWCHFSEPVDDPRLIDLNLRVFKNPRGWLKFSYLLFQRGTSKSPPGLFRAIGDLHQSGPGGLAIDLCQPKEKRVLRIPKTAPRDVTSKLVRGAIVRLDENGKIRK